MVGHRPVSKTYHPHVLPQEESEQIPLVKVNFLWHSSRGIWPLHLGQPILGGYMYTVGA